MENGQSIDTANIGNTRHRTKTHKAITTQNIKKDEQQGKDSTQKKTKQQNKTKQYKQQTNKQWG